MPHEFDVDVSSSATVEQVCAAFAAAEYWAARFAAFDAAMSLDELTVDADGVIHVATVQDLRHDGLPPILARVYPRDLKVIGTEVWTPVGEGRVEGRIGIDVVGAPGSGTGNALLETSGAGSRLQIDGSVRFGVPLIGGRIEKHLAREFAAHIPDVQSFTTDWIAARV